MAEDKWREWEVKYRKRNIINLTINNMQNSSSPKYSLNKTDFYKLGRLLLIMLAGTVLTYLSSILFNINIVIPLGGSVLNLTPILIPVFSLLIDTGRKYLNDYSQGLDIPA